MDAVSWLFAMVLAVLLRYDFHFDSVRWIPLMILVGCAVLLQLGFGLAVHAYQGRYIRATFEEVRYLGISALLTAAVLAVVTIIWSPVLRIPRSIMPIAFPIALLLMFVARYFARATHESQMKPSKEAEPALVYGAGYVGTHLIQWTSTDVESPYVPVGVLDDDPAKHGMRIRSTPVLGSFDSLDKFAMETDAKVLIVAIGAASASLLRRVHEAAAKCGLQVKVMPPLGDVMARGVKGTDLRDLSIEDLLGRQVVDTNVSEIAGYITGHRILVTGAGGSIGSQLCTEIKKYGPSELIMLDRDETGLQQAQINTVGNGLLDTPDVVLVDIRDRDTLKKIFSERRPQVVFHAAALKHLPMLEQYPDEAWKTNVLGTLNVLEAASEVGVETFINISTDKAANPTSVLGYSKRVAERLTAWMGDRTKKRYLSVRFGNVIGSRGSMLPTFTRLITEGKPLTVTHPDATRYFMTIPEACQLVLQAGGIGRSGEVLILDMGEPVRILDVAEQMISLSGKQVEIVFTGLRGGEKLNEELVGEGEDEDRPFHPKISHARVQGLGKEQLKKEKWDDGSLLKLGIND